MHIRSYRSEDCPELASLFYNTVHTVCARDYTLEQLDAWAPGCVDCAAWDRSFLEHDTLVAVHNGYILGFGDMRPDGYLDRLYVHSLHQGQGVATALCGLLEARCPSALLYTHASITARPFFKSRGYRVVRPQQVSRSGELLTNFVMEKRRSL